MQWLKNDCIQRMPPLNRCASGSALIFSTIADLAHSVPNVVQDLV
ncbi:hypothetical protein PSE_1372 [Pseudovibrio sp. FO-BEG1]|nr:hypothetical protein PSE_1372 [Pseudovibrio sp. FO-BEG1]